jgi:hypothetical protein
VSFKTTAQAARSSVSLRSLAPLRSRVRLRPSSLELRLAAHSTAILCAFALWAASLPRIDLRQMNDLGLASVLPVPTYLALALLTVSFCIALRLPRWAEPVLLLHVIAAIIMLYGIPSLVEAGPRHSATWRHAGIANVVMATGAVDSTVDAYFSWPGFFIMLGFIAKLAGYSSAIHLAGWAPMVFNLLWLGPVLVILRSASRDLRLVWLGVWLFYINNWVDQDYLSPQAVAYFAHLVILAVLLRHFSGRSKIRTDRSVVHAAKTWLRNRRLPTLPPRLRVAGRTVEPGPAAASPRVRVGLMLSMILIFGVMVATHQLTPFATFGSVTVLVIADRSRVRGLPALMFLLLGAWLSYMTVDYLSGHFDQVTGQVGALQQTVNSSVNNRVSGSATHQFVVRLRIAVTLLFWGMAAAGAARQLRERRFNLGFGLLALAPFPLMLLQPYGGEILLRVALFSLPFMAFFAAASFYPTATHGASRVATAGVTVFALGVLGAFLIARYGNERLDYYTREEIAGVKALYRIAPPGSQLVAVAPAVPWRETGYTSYNYAQFTGQPKKSGAQPGESDSDVDGRVPDRVLVDAVAKRMGDVKRGQRSYLITTRSQKAYLDTFGTWRRGGLANMERLLAASPRFRVVFSNRDTKIFTFAGSRGTKP